MGKEKKFQQQQLFFLTDEMTEDRVLVVQNPDNYVFTSKEQLEAYKKMKQAELDRLKDKRGEYLMAKNEHVRGLEGTDITVADRRYFMQLVLFAGFNGEPLKKDGEPLTISMIADIWGVQRETASRRLRKFVNHHLLEKIKVGNEFQFVLNELHFSKGKKTVKPGEKFVKLFQQQLKYVIERVEKIQESANKNPKRKKKIEILDVIGLLHAVMPYFHYQTYYLVSNPDDDILEHEEKVLDAFKRDPKALKHLSKTQIGRLLGHQNPDRRTIDKYMDYLQRAGAVMIMINNDKTRYMIHPDLMFRLDSNGEDEYTEHIRALFNNHR